jgi:hypothetical protein
MKKYDTMPVGLGGGLIAPAIVFIIYFLVHDPGLNFVDMIHRLVESKVISYYISLCAIANLLLFFIFLRVNAEKAARGVLGATILYAFTVLALKLA